jgi:hypothetical protein
MHSGFHAAVIFAAIRRASRFMLIFVKRALTQSENCSDALRIVKRF